MKASFKAFALILLVLLKESNCAYEDVISNSLSDYETFEKYWNYLYPWGSDHNGSARMYGDSEDHTNIYLENEQIVLKACKIDYDEGKSNFDPYLEIHYHSGTIHAKEIIVVDDEYPYWEIKGEFQAPFEPGTWPAFWITGVDEWPPEVDILEFKGDNTNWFNTFRTPGDPKDVWTHKDQVGEGFHEFKIWMEKVSDTDVDVHFYIDDQWKDKHTGHFVGKPFYLIMNFQMEGSAGVGGPDGCTLYKGRNIYVGKAHDLEEIKNNNA